MPQYKISKLPPKKEGCRIIEASEDEGVKLNCDSRIYWLAPDGEVYRKLPGELLIQGSEVYKEVKAAKEPEGNLILAGIKDCGDLAGYEKSIVEWLKCLDMELRMAGITKDSVLDIYKEMKPSPAGVS